MDWPPRLLRYTDCNGTSMTETPQTESRLPKWLPLGLATFGVLGLVRWKSLVAIEIGRRGVEEANAAWNAANALPEQLLHVAVFGLAGALLLSQAKERRLGFAALAAIAFALALTGYPTSPSGFVPSGEFGFGLANTIALVGIAVLWAGVGSGLAGMVDRGGAARVGLLVVGVGLAWMPWQLGRLSVDVKPMPVYSTVRQLLKDEEFAKLTYTEWPPSFSAEIRQFARMKKEEGKDFDPAKLDHEFKTGDDFRGHAQNHLRTMITPAVFKEYDVGDKYTLIAPPPTTIEFEIEESDGPVLLQTSAGADSMCFDRRHRPPSNYEVRFEVVVNGELRWEATQAIKFGLDAKERQWKHVGGEEGLALQPGDNVQLKTSFASDHDPKDLHPFRALWCGWSDLLLNRVEPVERLHSSHDHPNIVLIVMDTLRADRMSSYGYGRNTTPNLTRLAESGVQYERAYSTSSWTWPSTASMLTGLYPAQHGVTSNAACTLARDNESIAEVLQRRGYTTAGFSCNPLIHQERYYDQGFEEWDATKAFRKGDEVNPLIFDWLHRNHGSRFFLYLHYADPHTPHHPHETDLINFAGTPPDDPPENIRKDNPGEKQHASWDWFDHYNGLINKEADFNKTLQDPDEIVPAHHQRWISDVYDASVASCDRYVGELLDKLASLGLDDQTLILFTADHGEEFLEHGRYGHGHSVFEEVVHVPLIVAGPGVPSGMRQSEPVSNRHVAPTIAWYAGSQLDTLPDEYGKDLTSPLRIGRELIQVQTSKGLLDGRKMYVLEGLIDGQDLWLYARKASRHTFEVIFPKEGPRIPVEQDLRRFDMTLDPEQLSPIHEQISAKSVDKEILKRLDHQDKARRGIPLPAGDSGDATLDDLGYTATGKKCECDPAEECSCGLRDEAESASAPTIGDATPGSDDSASSGQ